MLSAFLDREDVRRLEDRKGLLTCDSTSPSEIVSYENPKTTLPEASLNEHRITEHRHGLRRFSHTVSRKAGLHRAGNRSEQLFSSANRRIEAHALGAVPGIRWRHVDPERLREEEW